MSVRISVNQKEGKMDEVILEIKEMKTDITVFKEQPNWSPTNWIGLEIKIFSQLRVGHQKSTGSNNFHFGHGQPVIGTTYPTRMKNPPWMINILNYTTKQRNWEHILIRDLNASLWRKISRFVVDRFSEDSKSDNSRCLTRHSKRLLQAAVE